MKLQRTLALGRREGLIEKRRCGMEAVFFYIFAVWTLVCGFLVVANPFSRNPVTSAMFLASASISLAGLFVLLHAFFLAAVQVLVYAGAVMVLFLFVLMIWGGDASERRRVRKFGTTVGLGSVAALLAIMAAALGGNGSSWKQPAVEGGARALGEALFVRHLLAFDVAAVLLLVAMLGVLVLGKRERNQSTP